ncbi:MAG: hypothetical protein F6J97_04085 [Leptolyngbya sp. SIO4C1]|nr:hypothetical protein [Leptolyngbya sp. SIO4C1]
MNAQNSAKFRERLMYLYMQGRLSLNQVLVLMQHRLSADAAADVLDVHTGDSLNHPQIG